MKKLITHSGFPHADDICSYAVLSVLFPTHVLIRTRDETLINQDEDKVVFDVSMKCDEDTYFDHHQKEKLVRPDGTPYSSIGLVWKKWGEEYVRTLYPDASSEFLTEVAKSFDTRFVYYIDVGDNGVLNDSTPIVTHDHSFSRMIGFAAADDTDETFVRLATQVARLFIDGYIAKIYSRLMDEKAVMNGTVDNGVLVLSEHIADYRAASAHESADDIYFVVFPNKHNGKWHVNTLEREIFVPKVPLLPSLAAKSREEIFDMTGVDGVTFVHTGLFLAVTETNDQATAIARLSLGNTNCEH